MKTKDEIKAMIDKTGNELKETCETIDNTLGKDMPVGQRIMLDEMKTDQRAFLRALWWVVEENE